MEGFSESDYSNSPEPPSPEPEVYDYSEAESSSPEPFKRSKKEEIIHLAQRCGLDVTQQEPLFNDDAQAEAVSSGFSRPPSKRIIAGYRYRHFESNEKRDFQSLDVHMKSKDAILPVSFTDDFGKNDLFVAGVSYPVTPQWNLDRPYLTGQHLFLDNDVASPSRPSTPREGYMKTEFVRKDSRTCLANCSPFVQEMKMIDDLLYAMVGIDGNYVRVQKGQAHDGNSFLFCIEPTMNRSVHDLAKRMIPLCENYMVVSQFAEARSHFRHGLTNHAFAAGLRAILQDYHAMIAQLEHQFRLERLSLQGLWFFTQPMIGAMQVVSDVVQIATVQRASGATLLNLLHNQATAMAGDSAARALLQKLTHAASSPYFRILERWVYEGVIDDPYKEFLIDENKSLKKESLSQDYHATYWQQRYSLRQEVPGFLVTSAELILTTGKYLNAIRECGHCIRGPSMDDIISGSHCTKRPYLERISVAHEYASTELLDLITGKFDLVGRLRSVKHYFFIDQGDFLVLFMDSAKDELAKRSSAISKQKLQSLLELAVRTSVATSDPYHEDLTCNVEKSSLLAQLENITESVQARRFQAESAEASTSHRAAVGSITGLDTVVLDYKVKWPVSLVLSRKALTKYQLIFRHLFQCKHVKRQLCAVWQIHQWGTRPFSIWGTAVSRSYAVCQRMLHYVQSFEHYMTLEVLEPNWHDMHNNLCSARTVDEVMQQHEAFLDKCLKQCMFYWPQIVKKVDNLKAICLQYAAATQRLIPTLFTSDKYYPVKSTSEASGDVRQRYKGRLLGKNKIDPKLARQAADDSNFTAVIENVEGEFIKELQVLIELLINGSQFEPYLAHLVQALEAVESTVSQPSLHLTFPNMKY